MAFPPRNVTVSRTQALAAGQGREEQLGRAVGIYRAPSVWVQCTTMVAQRRGINKTEDQIRAQPQHLRPHTAAKAEFVRRGVPVTRSERRHRDCQRRTRMETTGRIVSEVLHLHGTSHQSESMCIPARWWRQRVGNPRF